MTYAIVVTDCLTQYTRLKLYLLNGDHSMQAERWLRDARLAGEIVVQAMAAPFYSRGATDDASLIPMLFALATLGAGCMDPQTPQVTEQGRDAVNDAPARAAPWFG